MINYATVKLDIGREPSLKTSHRQKFWRWNENTPLIQKVNYWKRWYCTIYKWLEMKIKHQGYDIHNIVNSKPIWKVRL